MKEFVVVGGGIGGCSAAALLNARGHDVTLLEKEPSLGGCASTFQRNNNRYNAGATTLSGYNEGGIVRELFDRVGVTPKLLISDPSIIIIQGDKEIPRYQNRELFLEKLQEHHPHSKHDEFWQLVYQIGEAFYAMNGYYYSNASLSKKLVSLMSIYPLLKTFWRYLWGNARSFIEKFYGGITSDYLDFLDAQILIVTQEKSEDVNFFTAAIALGYTFNETHYVVGGMGRACETLTSKMKNIHTSSPVKLIERKKDRFILRTSTDIIETKNLIMGTSHYESSKWFTNDEIQKYYQKYKNLNNYKSAFVLYLTIRSTRTFHHHYQFIAKEVFPHTLSKALFVSFSDPSDTDLSPQGFYKITASIHTDSREWLSLQPSHYQIKKKFLSSLLQQWICDTLFLNTDDIIESFAATPKTFGKYLNRTQLGGNAMSLSNFLPRLPSNDTPIQGFYQVGDTAYAAQGWPGIAMGALNLMKLLP